MRLIVLVFLVLIQMKINMIECCKEVQVQQNFDINSFISKRWYAHQQMVVKYLPLEQNNCVYAEYQLLSKKSFWGFDVQVHNQAFDRSKNKKYDSGTFICAKKTEEPAKLVVGPCYFPRIAGWTTGPYWILSYDEDMGYALVIGGQPTIQTDQGCKTGNGVNNSGLWIFTRDSKRNQQLIDYVREIAKSQGLDVSVLNDIDHTNCSY